MQPLSPLPHGLVAVVGDEQSGKTTLLRQLSGDLPHALTHSDAFWLDLALPGLDAQTPQQIWQTLQAQHPRWQPAWQTDLAKALGLTPHLDKALYMLSSGSRRKVALVALMCSGAQLTCIDQPYVALDTASVRVLRDFWGDMVDQPRTWVIADYVADPDIPWTQIIELPLNL